MLSQDAQNELLVLAKNSIVHYLRHHQMPDYVCTSSELSQISGGFVTLMIDQCLRGCIGEIFPTRDIFSVVKERAVSAAFYDPRFEPLSESELPKINIEISVLTPPIPIKDISEIQIGQHGIVLTKGPYKSVFLPQVAIEQGWDLETTLKHLAMKAGLSSYEGCSFEIFTAQVFS